MDDQGDHACQPRTQWKQERGWPNYSAYHVGCSPSATMTYLIYLELWHPGLSWPILPSILEISNHWENGHLKRKIHWDPRGMNHHIWRLRFFFLKRCFFFLTRTASLQKTALHCNPNKDIGLARCSNFGNVRKNHSSWGVLDFRFEKSRWLPLALRACLRKDEPEVESLRARWLGRAQCTVLQNIPLIDVYTYMCIYIYIWYSIYIYIYIIYTSAVN